ncbi:hypothetical protein IIA15_07120 [candidate division TA06 bacterium]|nr:hypothetical protein [candidate division TA06 bacterium]
MKRKWKFHFEADQLTSLKKDRKNPPGGERGIALLISLMCITLFALLASGFVAIGVRNTHLGADLHHTSEALSSAEAGVHFAFGQMNAGEIVPPEPILGDPTWVNWVENLVTPGYESDVQISFVPELMLPNFDPITLKIAEEDMYYRILSTGEGLRETKRNVEVIMTPDDGIYGPLFDNAWQFGFDVRFSGKPVTFSGHSDTLTIKLDGGDPTKPYIDTNGNNTFDQGTEWGLTHGTKNLSDITLSDPHPDHPLFWPSAPSLHSNGDIHSNNEIRFPPNLHINGEVTTAEEIDPPFVNVENKYIRNGYTEYADSLFVEDIPTDSAFWAEIARKNTKVHFITIDNYWEYPGWSQVGQFGGIPRFLWNGNAKIPDGVYYILGHIQISGNPTTNAILITDYTIKVSGLPTNWGNDMAGYIAGDDIEIAGNIYLQGVIYTKKFLDVSGNPTIFGAVYAGGNSAGGGPPKTISGNPIVIYDIALKDMRWVIVEPNPSIASWQEVYE